MIGILALLVVPVVGGAIQVSRGRRSRLSAAVLVIGCLGVSAMVLVLLAAQALLADEGALPPDDLRSRLPAWVEIAQQDRSCGSGGCRRDYTVRDVGGAAAGIIADKLRATDLDGCRRSIWWPDLRQRCTYVSVTGDRVLVSVYLQGL